MSCSRTSRVGATNRPPPGSRCRKVSRTARTPTTSGSRPTNCANWSSNMPESDAASAGKSTSAEFLPYGRQSVSEDDIEAVVSVLRGDWLTTGPAVAKFEADLAEYTGGTPAVAVTSGTAALHVAYAAAGIGAGDEVVASPMTFVATAATAALHGAKVV